MGELLPAIVEQFDRQLSEPGPVNDLDGEYGRTAVAVCLL